MKLETNLAQTKKGFTNKFKAFFKNPSVRNEGDGELEGFKMNQAERE